jgi:prepilin-type N-terminal cleavage/methylation domain-containing protein
MKKRKFSLLEVLVVVAIIGVLASLLLPALAKARKQSKRAVCASQYKQIYYSYTMYNDDHDLVLPAHDGSNATTYATRLNEMYDLTYEVFLCPDDELQRTGGEANTYSLNIGTGSSTNNGAARRDNKKNFSQYEIASDTILSLPRRQINNRVNHT